MGGMLSNKFVSKVILIKGILNTLLGVVHIVGAFTFEASKIARQGTIEMWRSHLIWFYGVGLFVLFMGLVDILCYRSLKVNLNFAWRIAFLCAVFTTLIGLSGVIIFGVSPPLQLLVTGIVGCVVLIFSKREFLHPEATCAV